MTRTIKRLIGIFAEGAQKQNINFSKSIPTFLSLDNSVKETRGQIKWKLPSSKITETKQTKHESTPFMSKTLSSGNKTIKSEGIY